MLSRQGKADQKKVVKARIYSPIKKVVFIFNTKEGILRKEPMNSRSLRIGNFEGVVYGFSSRFIKDLQTMSQKRLFFK